MLSDATGLPLVTNATEQRGLLLGFALGLAFLIFPSRQIKVPPVADLALAFVGAVTGSLVWWHYDSISANPGNPSDFSLIVAFIGTVMLIVAAARVFGWLGAVVVALLAFQGFLLAVLGETRSDSLQTIIGKHWLTTESIFGIPLGVWGELGFLFVVLGVGLDILDAKRPVVRWTLRPLPQSANPSDQAAGHPFARRFWALSFLLIVNLLVGSWFYDDVDPVDALFAVAGSAVANAAIYVVSLAIAWAALKVDSEGWRRRGVWLGVGGMLLAVAQFTILIVAVALAIVFQGIAALLPEGLHRIGSSWWLLLWVVASLPLAAALLRATTTFRQSVFRAGLALLPVTLLFWGLMVQRLSPSLSAFYAVLLLAVVLVEDWGTRRYRVEGVTLSGNYVYPLCHGVARVMVRVVVIAAAYGMFIAYAWYWVPVLGLG